MILGKITKSDSQIHSICQVNGPHEAEVVSKPADYAFGRFVKLAQASSALHPRNVRQPVQPPGGTELYVVGVISDTILRNPGLVAPGPHLSNEVQAEVFAPDYLAEQAVFVHVLTLGMMELEHSADGPARIVTRMHGVPLALTQDTSVETMTNEEIRAFHVSGNPTNVALELGYLSHLRTEGNTLFPAVVFEIIRQLESLFPREGQALLGVVKRTVAWKHKVVPMA